MIDVLSRAAAQKQADEIRACREELMRLENENVLRLAPEQRQAIDAHHEARLAALARCFDIDRDMRAKQLSWGMRIASFLGALALAASVFFFFRQFWDLFSEPIQTGILIGAALGSFILTLAIRERDATAYFTKLAAMVAFACFVLDVSLIGQIYNLTPSDKALLLWAALAFLLAYVCDLRLLLAAGILCLMAYVAARFGTWRGMYWLDFGERPENFMPLSLALFVLPQIWQSRAYAHFAPIYRVFGLLSLLLPTLFLANWGRASYLPWSVSVVEGAYQVCGFALSAGVAWLGVRRSWTETVNVGVIFFVIFLYTKFYDWWWEIMPKYLFFLILGLTAMLALLIMKRLRYSECGDKTGKEEVAS